MVREDALGPAFDEADITMEFAGTTVDNEEGSIGKREMVLTVPAATEEEAIAKADSALTRGALRAPTSARGLQGASASCLETIGR